MSMRIDSHQHFWRYSEAEYPWIRKGTPLERDWLPRDLEAIASSVGVNGAIAVQARQSVEETRWLLQLAAESPFIKGVVGWVDLQSDQVEQQLAEFSTNKKFVGVRHVVQDEPDSQFMLKPEFLRGIGKLKQFELAYDFLLYPKQLPAAIQVAAKFPEQRFVLDHVAKPLIRAGMLKPWRDDLKELARNPNVFCKISGLVAEARHDAWSKDDFRPYLDIVIQHFGEERVMFGSDWPVCLLAASYAQVHQLVADYFSQFSQETQLKFFGQTAASFYLLPD
ncbi:MAG TPA: amidohydrolase family protein [Candidatus Acidoferrum sp.]|nr:amidohydrolase family protein [Candidatus Acidoferrum sp.]